MVVVVGRRPGREGLYKCNIGTYHTYRFPDIRYQQDSLPCPVIQSLSHPATQLPSYHHVFYPQPDTQTPSHPPTLTPSPRHHDYVVGLRQVHEDREESQDQCSIMLPWSITLTHLVLALRRGEIRGEKGEIRGIGQGTYISQTVLAELRAFAMFIILDWAC